MNFKTYVENINQFPEYLWVHVEGQMLSGAQSGNTLVFKRTGSPNGFYREILRKTAIRWRNGKQVWIETKKAPARPLTEIKKFHGEENVEYMTKQEFKDMMVLDQI